MKFLPALSSALLLSLLVQGYREPSVSSAIDINSQDAKKIRDLDREEPVILNVETEDVDVGEPTQSSTRNATISNVASTKTDLGILIQSTMKQLDDEGTKPQEPQDSLETHQAKDALNEPKDYSLINQTTQTGDEGTQEDSSEPHEAQDFSEPHEAQNAFNEPENYSLINQTTQTGEEDYSLINQTTQTGDEGTQEDSLESHEAQRIKAAGDEGPAQLETSHQQHESQARCMIENKDYEYSMPGSLIGAFRRCCPGLKRKNHPTTFLNSHGVREPGWVFYCVNKKLSADGEETYVWVTLEKTAQGESLGMKIDHKEGSQEGRPILVVGGITPGGLVDKFNKRQSEPSQKGVTIGDRIVSVNGIDDDVHRMIEECGKMKIVLVLISGN